MTEPYPARSSSASKKLLKQIPSLAQIGKALGSLNGIPHASLAITGTAYLQHMVERALKSKFVALRKEDENKIFDSGTGGFLCTFSAQIRLCYAMGLIVRETYEDWLMINDIRNTFAHSMHQIDFKHELIARDCEALWFKFPESTFSPENLANKNYVNFLNAIFAYCILARGLAVNQPIRRVEDIQELLVSFMPAKP